MTARTWMVRNFPNRINIEDFNEEIDGTEIWQAVQLLSHANENVVSVFASSEPFA